MNAAFHDLQDARNMMDGMKIHDGRSLDTLFGSFKDRKAFFFELVGENDFTLAIGYAGDIGCVQYSTSDGNAPYLMAVDDEVQGDEPFAEFLAGDTPTPVLRRFCLPIDRIKRIVLDFVTHGGKSAVVRWEEI